MDASAKPAPRRDGAAAVHSLHRFVFTVPDLDAAAAFYTDFGLDARRRADARRSVHVRLTTTAGARSTRSPGRSAFST